MQIYLTPIKVEAEQSDHVRWLRLSQGNSSVVVFLASDCDFAAALALAESFNQLLKAPQ